MPELFKAEERERKLWPAYVEAPKPTVDIEEAP
jgi:hypothetical protein